ncbi:MAG: fructose 1,6-bisphosphatase [Betaproteobacteria bacterium]|nr:fructose 1,6-bisphosphatase [Betaproteobacteria bacterium]MBI3055947.1 fructose 1,6-bisphosphatase [Betaproteobacteria bacterium]
MAVCAQPSSARAERSVTSFAIRVRVRRQGFFGAAMLPMSELEYTGIVERLRALDGRFHLRGAA